MPYDKLSELARVRKYYSGDPRQKRFSALVTGETGSGKTFMLRTARKPVHIDSFDPGGSKCLAPWIKKGDVIVDSSWEAEDPFAPDKFAEWMKSVDIRIQTGYFDMFGTYVIDSASTWGDAVMNYQLNLKGRAGESPKWSHDYVPQKNYMINYIKKLMNLSCDFILTGHLRDIEETIGHNKAGEPIKRTKYRFLTTGQAVVTIPLQFDELYVIVGESSSSGVKRSMLIDSQGTYIARSRLKSDGKLEATEDPDIRKILKKIGLTWEDKTRLEAEESK